MCGRAVCPPLPNSDTSTWSHAAVIAPTRTPTWPVGIRGSQCRAKISLTPSRTPAATARDAPPGTDSSAGWKISRTRPAAGRCASS